MKILRNLFLSMVGAAALAGSCPGNSFAAGVPTAAADTVVNAQGAFVKMPAQTLDLLSTSMRLDLLEYMRHDSIYQVPNALEGLSYLIPPVTADYLKVQVTPVTTFTVRMLPHKDMPIVATAYTVGDSLQAADTQLRFFDARMKELKLDKIIELLSTEDFLDTRGLSRKERDELLYLVPYPTVEYRFTPGSTDLHARLTVGEFLSNEANEKIAPYLRRDRVFKWDGHKYRLEKLEERK